MTKRLLLAVLLLGGATPVAGSAQSSQFGIRGIGIPNPGWSTRARGMGGAISLFDPASTQGEASLTSVQTLIAGIHSLQENRTVNTPGGSGDVRNFRFPVFHLGGPIKQWGVWLGASGSTYTNHDFGVAVEDSVFTRGSWVATTDTLVSVGGLNDLKFAAAIEAGTRWSLGAAFHIISGSTRNRVRRIFADSSYRSFRDSTEFSFSAVGFSASAMGQLSRTLTVALSVRSDGSATAKRDSTAEGSLDLPWSFAAGLRWRSSARLVLAAQGTYQTWSAANSDLLAVGGNGAKNTLSVGIGAEYGRASGEGTSLPLRVGIRYGQFPFPLFPDTQAEELVASLGTGLRLASNRASIDLAVERAWRKETRGWTENAWHWALGITLLP